MNERRYDFVILGLSLSSSWGNGHATTWRSLVKGLRALGQRVLFLERDVPWYAENRDLDHSEDCDLVLYRSVAELEERHGQTIADAGAVIVGSYVPDGIAVLDLVLARALGKVCFYDIDSPVTVAALERGEPTYIARRQIPALDAYLSFSGGSILRRIENAHGAVAAHAFFCSVDAAAYRPDEVPPVYDLGYLGTYSPDRQPALERLLLDVARRLPEHRFVVAGPNYPADVDWPTNVERIEHLPPPEHRRFYARQRFTLNVTRADMVKAGWSPSVRLFEAASCGTALISDAWPGLTELLPKDEAILVADGTEDVIRALVTMDDAARRRMAERARERILAEHTSEARARQLCAIVGHLSAASPRARPQPGIGRRTTERELAASRW